MLHRFTPLLLLAAACAGPRSAESAQLEIVALQYAQASEVARVVNSAVADRAGDTARVVADVRTNSLVIQASSQRLEAIKEVIAALDHEVR